MDAELRRAIERLYREFERYPLRPSTEPCLHCHEPHEEQPLHEHLLRDLTADQLSGFASEALMVWGNEVDFKHFLPRILEITVTEEAFDWPDIESLFGRLAYGRWSDWPAPEREAIEQFLHSFWRAGLAEYPSRHDIGSMLTAIADTGVDLQPFLETWLTEPGEAPLRHLAEFAQHHASLLLTRDRLSNAFWGVEQRGQADTLKSWIMTGKPRERLVDAFFASSTSEVEEDLSVAVRVLEALEAIPEPK